MGNAWLLGVYTIEIDLRIEELGYQVTQVFATAEAIDSFSNPPDLLVFADDGMMQLTAMETLRHVFPTTVIVAIPSSSAFLEDCQSYTDRRLHHQSVARLLQQINEREHRWEN